MRLEGSDFVLDTEARERQIYEQLTQVGARGHDFEYLKGSLKERRRGRNKMDREILGALAVFLQVVSSWSTDLRYQVGTLKPREAERFFSAAKAIRDTCLRSSG